MKTHIFVAAVLSLPVLLQAGCSPITTPGEEPAGQIRQGLVTIDSSNLFTLPPGGIPERRLTLQAFAGANVRQALIQTAEPFTLAAAWGNRARWSSASWVYEVNSLKGQVFALKQTPNGQPAPQDEQRLQELATARLNAFGIPGEEIGPVLQRRLLIDEVDENGQRGQTLLFNYKTFFLRAINGVRVTGHRAVVTHDLDGTGYRVLLRWPALAAGGHLLHTWLSRQEIEARALLALEAEGIISGTATLVWRYYATPQPNGEVTLTLRVEAHVPAPEQGIGEPRAVLVNVDAVP